MNAYSVFSKATGELLEVCKASNNQTARIGASREILEITMATADEIVEFTKRGGEIRVYQPESRKPKVVDVDPAQTDLVKEVESVEKLQAEMAKVEPTKLAIIDTATAGVALEDSVSQLQADAESRDQDPEPEPEPPKATSDDPFGD